MSWRVLVRHRTGHRYASPAFASYNEARMLPDTGAGQLTLEARLDVSPAARPFRYRDYWGTLVAAFDVHEPHSELAVVATAVVETAGEHPGGADADWADVLRPEVQDEFAQLLAPSRFVIAEPEVTAVGATLAAAHSPLEAGRRAAVWAHDRLRYERGATDVHTTSAQARAGGSGVCQDYAHVALALLRAMRLPSRYVSGYFLPVDRAIGETTRGESHAWVEFWAGEWVPVDPTNLAPVADRYVTVARGRDYADVRPLSGVYHGPPADVLGVTVELTRLR